MHILAASSSACFRTTSSLGHRASSAATATGRFALLLLLLLLLLLPVVCSHGLRHAVETVSLQQGCQLSLYAGYQLGPLKCKGRVELHQRGTCRAVQQQQKAVRQMPDARMAEAGDSWRSTAAWRLPAGV
jgi:hypothetical protein